MATKSSGKSWRNTEISKSFVLIRVRFEYEENKLQCSCTHLFQAMHTRPKMLAPVRAGCSDRHFGRLKKSNSILSKSFINLWYSSSSISLRERWAHAEDLHTALLCGDWKVRMGRMDLSTNQRQEAPALIPGYGKKSICVVPKITCLKREPWLIPSSTLFEHVWN